MTGKGKGENNADESNSAAETARKVVDLQQYRSSQSADDQALVWLAKLRNSDLSLAEQARFALWLHTSRANKRAFDAASDLWLLLGEIEPDSATTRLRKGPGNSSPAQPASSYHRWAPFSVAASVLISAVVLVLGMTTPTYVTDKGEQRRVILPDGSVALLNTATAIEVNYTGQTRQIKLNTGEAWFDVASNPNRPFIVTHGDIAAQAIGTAFAVRSFDARTRISVSEGRVGLQRNGVTLPITLDAGQQAVVDESMAERSEFSPVKALAWRQGQLIYSDQPLEDVLADLSRYLPRNMTVSDTQLGARRVSAVLHLGDQQAMLDALAAALPLRWKTVSDNLIIVSPANGA